VPGRRAALAINNNAGKSTLTPLDPTFSEQRECVKACTPYYHAERNHRGLDNQLIAPEPALSRKAGAVVRGDRLGGLLSYYYREVA
jgi:hypothetical protein